jgi:DNA-binding GntR family transcriptional regulator
MSSEGVKQRMLAVRAKFDEPANGSLRERVFRALRASILGGQLVRGDRITEADLSEALNVSRTPLREAFRGLEAEGLVTVADQRGLVVRGLTAEDFLEIYEIRAVLDVLAARRAAERISDKALKELANNVEMAEFLMKKKRWPELRQQFRRFHELVQESCGNARLCGLLCDLQDYSSRSSEFTLPTAKNAPSTHADHISLFKALSAHDSEAAAKVALAHIENERRKMLMVSQAGGKARKKPVAVEG